MIYVYGVDQIILIVQNKYRKRKKIKRHCGSIIEIRERLKCMRIKQLPARNWLQYIKKFNLNCIHDKNIYFTGNLLLIKNLYLISNKFIFGLFEHMYSYFMDFRITIYRNPGGPRITS